MLDKPTARDKLLVTGGSQFDWEKLKPRIQQDKPSNGIIHVTNLLYNKGIRLYIHSARSEIVRAETLNWLEIYKVRYTKLQMRPKGDGRTESVLKREWLQKLPKGQLLFALDNKVQAIRMYRRLNITTMMVNSDGLTQFAQAMVDTEERETPAPTRDEMRKALAYMYHALEPSEDLR